MSRINNITLLGGTGFVGTQLTVDLARYCDQVTVLTRHKQRCRDLQVLTNVDIKECDVHNQDALVEAINDANVVINLVGILNQSHGSDNNSFESAHAELTRKVVEAVRSSSVSHYLHMSSLGADADNGSSEYLRSKGLAERHVQTVLSDSTPATIFRPSVIFGAEDSFFNRFATLLRAMPIFPLACPDARMSPVYVQDVCNAMMTALDLEVETSSGNYKLHAADQGMGLRSVELCGPADYTLRELVQFTADTMGIKRKIIGLPDWAARAQGKVMGMLPAAPFSTDNYLSLQTDSICEDENCRQPTSIQSVVPRYLGDQGLRSDQQRYRTLARR